MLPENQDALSAFFLVQTQWRWDRGERTGLDYASCERALKAHKMDFDALLPGLQVMERETLLAAAERGNQSGEAIDGEHYH